MAGQFSSGPMYAQQGMPCMSPVPVPQQAPGLTAPVVAPPPPTVFPMQGPQQSVESWSVEKVVEGLSISGLGHLSHNFESHRITGDILRELSSTDLEEIGVHALGDKKRFLRAASQLHGAAMPTLQNVAPPPPPSLPAP